MSGSRTPTVAEFQNFFLARLRGISPREELVWLSSQVPVEALAAAYPLGIFPWPGEADDFFPWVCPRQRGILRLDHFRLGRSSRRQLRQAGFEVTFNRDFAGVISACDQAHQPESWIHPRMREAYQQAHELGFAHSVEVWQNGELAGGLYGVDSGHFFSGESMFHRVPQAGKAAVAALVTRQRARGDALLDIQQLTPHMRAMGAEAISRRQFLDWILEGRPPAAAVARLRSVRTGSDTV